MTALKQLATHHQQIARLTLLFGILLTPVACTNSAPAASSVRYQAVSRGTGKPAAGSRIPPARRAGTCGPTGRCRRASS